MRWLLLFIIVGIIVFFLSRKDSAPPPKPPATVTPVDTIVPQAPPAPVSFTPIPAAATPNLPAQLAAVAERAGVRLVHFRPETGGAVVVVEWSSDVATQGADFIEGALREGLIRDFDPTPRLNGRMDQGRRVFIAQYQVKF